MCEPDVFDDRVHEVLDDLDSKMVPTHECRICEKPLYGGDRQCTCKCGLCGPSLDAMDYNDHNARDCHVGVDEGMDYCFWCYMKRRDSEREYVAILTHGGTRGSAD